MLRSEKEKDTPEASPTTQGMSGESGAVGPGPGADLDLDLSGLDALELEAAPAQSKVKLIWDRVWPRAAAVLLGLGLWQTVVWTGWRPEYALPPPGRVLSRFARDLTDGQLHQAVAVTLSRAGTGFLLAVGFGTLLGIAVARSRALRSAIGSMITGLQTMPSIAWFPLAILLFKLSEAAILFVVVLGAAPSVANGLLSGVDHVPPVLVRAGRVMGAKGLTAFRYVTFPAALPAYVAGLKQGWAFAWRSLMAGELLAVVANRPSIGVRLNQSRELADVDGLVATMMVILIIGITIDAALFGLLEKRIRRRRGLGIESH